MVGALPMVIFRDRQISRSSSIHFYFDGDRNPWVGGSRIASDPTTRSKLILEMMAADEAHKILIGRPCYYIPATERPSSCADKWWTSHRYSQPVVSAMLEVVRRQVKQYVPQEIVLIGYSGGGTLAALVASELEELDVLVTVAANLNVDAWIDLHAYTPLARLLNEANFPEIPADVRQFHIV